MNPKKPTVEELLAEAERREQAAFEHQIDAESLSPVEKILRKISPPMTGGAIEDASSPSEKKPGMERK